MELMAVIAGLEAMKRGDLNITIYSDSQYVVKAIKEGWLSNWLKINFKGKKNKDLWLRYHALAVNQNIKMVWVRGHAENVHNNRCDELATAAADSYNLLIDEGYEQENK
jgi:ribonuclease HI